MLMKVIYLIVYEHQIELYWKQTTVNVTEAWMLLWLNQIQSN